VKIIEELLQIANYLLLLLKMMLIMENSNIVHSVNKRGQDLYQLRKVRKCSKT